MPPFEQTRAGSGRNDALSTDAEYRAIFDTAVEAIAVIDETGIIQSVNPATHSIFGYKREELIGRNVAMLMPDSAGGEHDHYLDRYRRTGQRKIIGIGREVQGRRKSGEIFPLELSIAEWRRDGARYFTGIMRDVSARKEAETALAESEARSRMVQQAVQAGVWEVDLQTDIVTLSQEAARLHGLPAGEGARMTRAEWGRLVHPDSLRQVSFAFDLAVETGDRYEIKVRLRPSGMGERWLQAIGQAYYGDDGTAERMFGISIDISERQQAEDSLRKSEERLSLLQNEFAHLSRVNDLGEMAAAIAHEINQPLTAISNYLTGIDLMLQNSGSAAPNDQLRQMLGEAADQALRAGKIVRRLREFVGKGNGVATKESAEGLVDAAMSISLLDAPFHAIDVIRQRGAEGTIVEVDAVQVQQVLVNLLRNAVDALSTNAQGVERRLRISTRRLGSSVEYEIADTGPGISADVRHQLFEPFVTSKPHGMGMGLALSQRLLETHGSELEVRSEEGKGAAFLFRLPLAATRE